MLFLYKCYQYQLWMLCIYNIDYTWYMNENQHIEWTSCQDDCQEWICGFSNAEVGVLVTTLINTPKTPVKTPVETLVETPVEKKMLVKKLGLNLEILGSNSEMIEKSISTVQHASAKLSKAGRLRYVGPSKGGHWEVLQ